ncbi:MAG: T9SS type A sorting domain-containing protein [Bacteroidia bacterium]
MRNYLLAIALTVFAPMHLLGQLWQTVGGGLNDAAYSLFPDSATGLLYVGGDFDSAGALKACNLASWNGANWNKVGTEPQDTLCPFAYATVISVAKFGGDVFAAGAFRFQGSSTYQYFIRWDGLTWDTTCRTNSGGWYEVVNGELLAMGIVNELNGTKVGRILRWNGVDTWESFGDSLAYTDPGWWIQSCTYYQGRHYFGGNFSTSNGISEVATWDGSSWNPLGNGILGDSWVNKLQAFQGQLFVGGEFDSSSGNASSYLTAWDGTSWYDPFPLVQYSNQVRDMQLIDGKLYILGTHRVWNGSTWQGPYELAHYDGQDFCSFGGDDIFPRDIAGLNGHIYITTNYTTHADPYNGIAEWIGGDSVDICVSQPVGRVEAVELDAARISAYPNPASDGFSIAFGDGTMQSGKVSVLDIAGRVVVPERTWRTGDSPVEVSMLPAGVYLVQVRVRDRVEYIKLIKN